MPLNLDTRRVGKSTVQFHEEWHRDTVIARATRGGPSNPRTWMAAQIEFSREFMEQIGVPSAAETMDHAVAALRSGTKFVGWFPRKRGR